MKPGLVLPLIILLIIPTVQATSTIQDDTYYQQSEQPLEVSIRNQIADAVIIPDSNPFFGLIGASAACWYDKETNTTGLLPLLVQHQGNLTDAQKRFLDTYASPLNHTLLILGNHLT